MKNRTKRLGMVLIVAIALQPTLTVHEPTIKNEVYLSKPTIEVEKPKEDLKDTLEEVVPTVIEPKEVPKPVIEEQKEVKAEPKPKPKATTPTTYKVELTGYCSDYECNKPYDNGITASGVYASKGTVAVPKNIPLGSKIYINGVEHRAEDRGGAIIVRDDGTYIVDVWFPSHQKALDFGRVKATMYKKGDEYYINYNK